MLIVSRFKFFFRKIIPLLFEIEFQSQCKEILSNPLIFEFEN